MRRRFLASALAAALAGCTALAPPYERPPAPVDTRFPGAPSADAAPVTDIDWRQFFTDARLQQLIALSLQGNRDLRLAALAIEQARAQAAVRDADRWPGVSAGVAGSQAPTATGSSNRLYTAGVQVTAWEVDLFGRLRDLSDAAAAQVLANVEARKAVQVSLVAAVATTHVALAADDELLRVTRAALATREASLKLVRLRVDNGASSALDLRQAESLLEAARVALAQATRQRALDENALALLVGQPLPATLPPARPIAAPGLPDLPVGLPSDVLLRRPDVRQSEQGLVAANANIGAARAAFFPRITLTASAGIASGDLAGLFTGPHLAWAFVPQLLQPLFDAGRNQANLQLAQTAREVAVLQYERTLQQAFREVADVLAGRATLGEQAAAQRRLVQAEAARSDLVELRYRNGAASHLELLDAQRSLLAAQQALVLVQAQQAQNAITLYKVLGGGWTAADGLR
jgi:multidrug efflux system outer membrane protein